MMAKIDTQGSVGVPEPVVLTASATAPVALPAGFPLSDAAFGRAGSDLVLTVPGHPPVVIRDFFAGDAFPALTTPDGAQITGELAARMAGPTAPGQVAAADMSVAAEAIGRIDTVSGHAFVVRADGSREELVVGSRLHAGDVLETGADSALGVVLADETSMSMGSDGRMVLDEMIYDPNTQEGSMALSVLKGVYTIVSGLVSKTDPDAMVIDTPVGSIGIRGTQVGLEIPDGRNLNIVMMREEGGYVGEVFIRNEAGLQVMNQAHQVVFIGGVEMPPTFTAPVDNAGVLQMFASTLMHLPKPTGHENDYSALNLHRGEGLENFETHAGPAEAEGPTVPTETIRVVEGDYTKPHLAAASGIPVPEAPRPAPLPERSAEPILREERPEETVVKPSPVVTPPSNEAPLAFDLALKTREDEAIVGRLSAVDPDSDSLNFALTDDGGPKHGTLKLNADGTYTYTPEADFSGVDSFTYLVSDGRGGTAAATASIDVAAVSDVPVLSVSSAVGAEDAAIPLAISAAVPGKEEVASLIIGGVPAGATLSAGADNGDGTWTLAGADLDKLGSLTLTPPADWSGDMTLSVTATSTDGGVAEAAFGVSVAPVVDVPVLTVAGTSGAEDTAIPLAISATVPGTEEVASITVGGVPAGATLSAGTNNGDGTWTLAGADLDDLGSLTLTPPADWSGDLSLTLTAASTDGGTATASFGVVVTPVPDVPVLTVAGVSGAEDAAIPLAISATVPGAEEVASITIGGVPAGATLSAGTDNGDGTWTLAGADLDKLGSLTLTPPPNSSADMTLTVTAQSTDGATATAGFTVAVAAVADVPIIQVSDIVVGGEGGEGGHEGGEGGHEGGEGHYEGGDVIYGGAGDDVLYGDGGIAAAATVPLPIQASLADVDGSESLAITVAGVPEGATLSAGTDMGDGSWSLTPDDLDGLSMSLPQGYQDDFQLQVTATATDVDVDSGAADQAATSAVINVTFEGGGSDDVIYGGGGDDVIYGGAGDDTLHGEGGADVLVGGAGNDKLYGEGGADVLVGGAGNDVLEGGGGGDVLKGGAGDDVLRGGGGDDTFVFQAGAGNDIIADYQKGEQLRFEGPEFSKDNLSVTQNGDAVKIMFGDQATQVTVNDVDLSQQGYTVSQDGDTVVITFDDQHGNR